METPNVILAALLAFCLFFAGCAAEAQKPGEKNNTTQLANPASAFCVEKGHSLEIRNGPAGQTGFCIFKNGNECEEWAYFRGECTENKKPSANTTPPAETFAKEGGFCGGIAGIRCAEGFGCKLDGIYPDAGGLCVKVPVTAGPVFLPCPSTRGDVCTMEYNPVCGRSGSSPSTYDYEDYPSPCVACSKSSPALAYVKGECASHSLSQKARDLSMLYDCPSVRFPYCTNETDPVCGRLVDPTASLSAYITFQNPCAACAVNTNAIAYYIGTCESRGNK